MFVSLTLEIHNSKLQITNCGVFCENDLKTWAKPIPFICNCEFAAVSRIDKL